MFLKTAKIIVLVICFVFCQSTIHAQPDLQKGNVQVSLTSLENGVVSVEAKLFIPCQPEDIWIVLTDYNHLYKFIPKMLHSELLKNEGDAKIIKQVARTGISIFQITARVQLRVQEKYLQRIDFEKMKGDFKVFRGSWLLQGADDSTGTVLTYQAEIKPLFPTPIILIKQVQKNDLPEILNAIKQRTQKVKIAKKNKCHVWIIISM